MTALLLAGAIGYVLLVALVISWLGANTRAGRACDRAVRRHVS